MKVALTDSHLDPARGGAQTYLRNFEVVMTVYLKVVERRREGKQT